MNEKYDTIIIGGGIAGLSAAVYTARGNNNPLVLQGDEPGGQLTLTNDVQNYPGFPEGISGVELVNKIKEQAEKFGAEVSQGIVTGFDKKDGEFTLHLSNKEIVKSESVIVASGASARMLDIPGEKELLGNGVSTCATCDGAFFKGEDMVVVGGGDAAFEEANFLTKFANTVYIVHRREEFRAEDYWVNKVQSKIDDGEIQILKNTEVVEINGDDETGVDSIKTVSHPDGHPTEREPTEVETEDMDVGAVFVAIGHIPNTDFLEDTKVNLNEEGYVITENTSGSGQTKTNVEGIFAAGDVVDYHYQQAATASGMGVKAALDVDEYLSN